MRHRETFTKAREVLEQEMIVGSTHMPPNPVWLELYLDFVDAAPLLSWPVGHRHHVVPREWKREYADCDKKGNEWNCKRLTYANHFRAHYYLFRTFPGYDAYPPCLGWTVKALALSRDEGLVQAIRAEYEKIRAIDCGWEVKFNADSVPPPHLDMAIKVLVLRGGDPKTGLIGEIAEEVGRIVEKLERSGRQLYAECRWYAGRRIPDVAELEALIERMESKG